MEVDINVQDNENDDDIAITTTNIFFRGFADASEGSSSRGVPGREVVFELRRLQSLQHSLHRSVVREVILAGQTQSEQCRVKGIVVKQ